MGKPYTENHVTISIRLLGAGIYTTRRLAVNTILNRPLKADGIESLKEIEGQRATPYLMRTVCLARVFGSLNGWADMEKDIRKNRGG